MNEKGNESLLSELVLYYYYNKLAKYNEHSYLGIDVSQIMIKATEKRYKGRLNARFAISSEPIKLLFDLYKLRITVGKRS